MLAMRLPSREWWQTGRQRPEAVPAQHQRTQRFCYTLGEVDLECDVEYEKASKGSWSEGQQMEPDEPESATLFAAYVRDVDVITMLDDDQIAKIEEAFLGQEWAL